MLDQIPRYARINTNLIEPVKLIEFLQTKEGGSFVFLEQGPYPDPLPTCVLSNLAFVCCWAHELSVCSKSFHIDEHIPNLLVFALAASSVLTSHIS